MATIVLSIDPSLLYVIGDPTEPTVVWEKLSTQFQKKTWVNKFVNAFTIKRGTEYSGACESNY